MELGKHKDIDIGVDTKQPNILKIVFAYSFSWFIFYAVYGPPKMKVMMSTTLGQIQRKVEGGPTGGERNFQLSRRKDIQGRLAAGSTGQPVGISNFLNMYNEK
jgi:hypothetical protein